MTCFAFVHGRDAATPNDNKLSDGPGWRGPCMAGGKVAAEARAVTASPVRCSAWLGRVLAWLKDPFWTRRGIERDWSDFKAMTEDELRQHWYELLEERPTGDRFRRLCHFLAMQWVLKRPNDPKLRGGGPESALTEHGGARRRRGLCMVGG